MRRGARPALSPAPLVAAVALVVAVSMSACGGAETVHRTIEASRVDDGTGFAPFTITVDKRNRVELEVGNTTPVAHGFAIEGYGIREEVQPGSTLDVKFTATNAGTYKIFCQIHPAHKTATLIVR